MMIDIYGKLFDTLIVKKNWTMQLDTNQCVKTCLGFFMALFENTKFQL